MSHHVRYCKHRNFSVVKLQRFLKLAVFLIIASGIFSGFLSSLYITQRAFNFESLLPSCYYCEVAKIPMFAVLVWLFQEHTSTARCVFVEDFSTNGTYINNRLVGEPPDSCISAGILPACNHCNSMQVRISLMYSKMVTSSVSSDRAAQVEY